MIQSCWHTCEKLEAAELDGELAAELGLAEMRDVLPDAPIAHCLLLVRRLSELKTVQPAIPDTPAWRVASSCDCYWRAGLQPQGSGHSQA